MSSPDTWREPEWLTYPWFGACACGRLRRTHVVRDASGEVDVIGRCDAGHETDLAEFVPWWAVPDNTSPDATSPEDRTTEGGSSRSSAW